MDLFLLVPFVVQLLAIAFDEIYFHFRRGLPRFERIGHPIDTLSVIVCFAFVLVVPYSSAMLKLFVALAIISCLMVTKDEFVHKHHCPAAEHWLHALLFLNHPILLSAAGLIWARNGQSDILSWIKHPAFFQLFLYVQLYMALLFFFYQVIYWNWIWKEKPER